MAATVSDSARTALAMHYRLVELDQLRKAGSNLDELVSAGVLDERKLAFLDRKAAETPDTAPAGEDFLSAAQALGHLTAVTAGKYAATLRAPMPDRDYEAACSLYNHDALELWQVIDVLESLRRPLQYSPDAKVAYYPADVSKVDPDATCPTTGQPLVPLTDIPGLDAKSLPESLDRLVITKLDPKLMSARKAGKLVIALARHYRLITPEQAELLADSGWTTVQEAVQQMFEEGFLTTSAFRFLLARAEEVLHAKGRGVLGTAKDRPLLEIAQTAGYLSAEALDTFLEEWQLPEAQDAAQMDMAVIALLFNRGFIEQYQAIDLLEKRGLVVDHSPIGGYQVLASEDQPPGLCPGSQTKMVRLTGWTDTKGLMKPLPEIERLVIHNVEGPALSAVPVEAEEGDFTLDGSRVMSLTAAIPEAELAQTIDEAQLDALIERYHIVPEDKRKEAAKIQKSTGRPLFDVLREYGFLTRPAQGFLRRRLGLTPNEYPPEAGLLELGAHFGYIDARSVGSKQRELLDELKLLGKAFNKGQFDFYQLMDLLETKEVWLEHSPKAQVQIYFAPGEFNPTDPPKLPSSLGEVLPLSRPGGIGDGRLPLPTRFKIARLEAEQAQLDDDHAVAELSDEPLPVQLALRYSLLPKRELDRAVRGWQKAGEPGTLAQYLFDSGKLTTQAMDFLIHKEEQVAGGEVHVGEMQDERLVEIALSKHYTTEKRLDKLFAMAGAPNREKGDDLSIGCFLQAKGALTFYQLIDLFEEKGYFLLTTPDHKRQYHMVGNIDPTADYACPATRVLLLPLTSAPGFPPRLERLPALKALHIQRRSNSDFPVLREGEGAVNQEAANQAIEQARPKTAEELLGMADLDPDASMFGLSVPTMVEVELDQSADGTVVTSAPKKAAPARPKRSKEAALKSRSDRASQTLQRTREAMQAFYDKEMPQRQMQTRAPKKPATRALGDVIQQRNQPDLKRLKKSEVAAIDMVNQGTNRMMKGLFALGLVLAIGQGIAVIILATRGDARREALAAAKAEEKLPAVEKQKTNALKADGQPVTAFGAVQRGSIDTLRKTFLLSVDLTTQVKVKCDSPATESAFPSLVKQVRSGGDTLLLMVSGTVKTDEDGVKFIAASEMSRHVGKPLPAERIR